MERYNAKKKLECKITCWLGLPLCENYYLYLSKDGKHLARSHKNEKCVVMIGLCIYF